MGFARIRSKGDTALFGGYTTEDMKKRLGIKSNRPLADFLPTLTIAAKNLAMRRHLRSCLRKRMMNKAHHFPGVTKMVKTG